MDCRGWEVPTDSRRAQRIVPAERADIAADTAAQPPREGAPLEVRPVCGTSLMAFIAMFGCVLATPFLVARSDQSAALAWRAATVAPSGPLHIVPGWTWQTDAKVAQVRGRVRNDGAVPITEWAVTVEFRDDGGRVLEAHVVSGRGTIAPGADAAYALDHPLAAAAAHVRVFVSRWAIADTR